MNLDLEVWTKLIDFRKLFVTRISSEWTIFFKYFVFSDSKKDLGGGTVLDLGVYVIQCCQWMFQQAPKSITATGKVNDEGVDLEMSAEIIYGDNKVGKVKTSALNTLNNKAVIVGTKGQITVNILF